MLSPVSVFVGFLGLAVVLWSSSSVAGPVHKAAAAGPTKPIVLPHYRVVTVLEPGFVDAAPAGSDAPYTGYCIDILDILATLGNFTYNISTQPDNEYGKKLKDGTWNGMVGSLVNNKADIALGIWAATKERAAVVDFATVADNFTEAILVNPKFGTKGVQYLVQKGFYLYLLKKSTDPRTKTIYQNVKKNLDAALVASLEEGAQKVASGKYAFVGDEDDIEAVALLSNGTLSEDPTPVETGIDLAFTAAKKGSKVAKHLQNAIMEILLYGAFSEVFEQVLEDSELPTK